MFSLNLPSRFSLLHFSLTISFNLSSLLDNILHQVHFLGHFFGLFVNRLNGIDFNIDAVNQKIDKGGVQVILELILVESGLLQK